MNIYDFVNSKDVKDYLKKINYKFSLMEAAWLIYQNSFYTFDVKCRAWENLIKSTKDETYIYKFFKNNKNGDDSFHSLLKRYIEIKKESFEKFKSKNDNSVYTCAVFYLNECEREKERTIFSDYDSLINYIKSDKPTYIHGKYNNDTNIYEKTESPFFDIHIEKHRLNDGKNLGCALLDNDLSLLNVFSHECDYNEKDEYLSSQLFDEFWFKIPVPFKKGDILVNIFAKKMGVCTGPFVLDRTCHDVYEGLRVGSDSSDMTYYGYFVANDGKLYYECNNNYMDLEYYNEEIVGVNRTLIPISNFLKDKINLDLCIDSYHYIINEENVIRNKKELWFTKEALVDGGIEKDEDKHIKIWLDDERPAPSGYFHCHSVNEIEGKICECERDNIKIDILDLDHDLGDFAKDGGDAIKLIDWLAETKKFYKINLHTMNPVGKENMQREIDRYWPKDI